MKKRLFTTLSLLCVLCTMAAQDFFNLTADEVRIDSVLPTFSYSFPLGSNYADSTYSVSIDYPEFIDMREADVRRYHAITTAPLPEMPVVHQQIGVSRKKGALEVQFVPLVFRNGKYQKLVSFKLTVHSQATHTTSRVRRLPKAAEAAETYTSHSVLATGQWAKISVPKSGVYQLTDALVRQAGFSNLNKVKVYGYGGALQPEVLTASYLAATDDLHEVPTCVVGGRRLFYGVGPVGWANVTTAERVRNPYSDYGCYFITESDDEPLMQDSATFVSSFYPSPNDYHELYEVDDYAWYHSGRNLFDSRLLANARTYELPAHSPSGQLTVAVTYDANCEVTVTVNDSLVGTISVTNGLPKYAKAAETVKTFQINNQLKANNTIVLQHTAGTAAVRLDYLQLTMPEAAEAPRLSSASFPVPQLNYRITNQDHHADEAVDMVIIIPTTQKLLAQAERLKTLHETYDSLSVRIVPADELYNEFSSGTPDANAYRRYMKMLYDRAQSEADMPRYLLLMGDGAWDNRMLSNDWRSLSPDDFLLCYESENSFSETYSYVSDDYFCLLDDGEGSNIMTRDKTDVGVGRLPARTDAEAKIFVDKIVDYRLNTYAGDWQNTICFMGDDGNNNVHMREADTAAKQVQSRFSGFNIKKIYWDAYTRITSSTGFRYIDVEKAVRQQMQNGALIMDYSGHGAPHSMSHERVLTRPDFEAQTSLRLPLWITASCDIMPFDSQEENIGETAMMNTRGGCIAFFGTTRTVFTGANADMNCAFLNYVLGTDNNGRRYAMGDAVRLAKNQLRGMASETYTANKLHYSLLGDPALQLASPTARIVVDSIDGQAVGNNVIQLTAGRPVTVKGHVADVPAFNGVVTLTVKDVEQQITCKLNDTSDDSGSETAFVFNDRPTTLYNGSDSIRNGQFALTFVLPRDISYSEATGMMIIYAVDHATMMKAHGQESRFAVASAIDGGNDGVGPSIYCYLNTSDFVNGGRVNTTPYFYAELSDKDGLNVAGSSIGHDLELVIDGSQTMTYSLNDYFQYDFGGYNSGSVGYSLPVLEPGDHSLLFRAWDVFNNSSVAELKFKVVRGLEPRCFSVECTRNPATTTTSFIINHDRTGSNMDVELEIFDTSGRMLWKRTETGISTDNTYIIDWDLTVNGSARLQTGVYLYRVLISSDGSKKASKAQKLIVLTK